MFIRGLLPVFRQERHLGSLEVGSDVRPLLEQAHAEAGANYALFSTEAEIQASGFLPEQYIQGHPLLFSTDGELLSRLPEGFLGRALAGEVLHCLQRNDQFMFSPITNAMDEVVGVLVTQVDASAFVTALSTMGRLFVFLVFGAVFVAFLLLLGMLRSLILTPLQKVTSLSSALALEGDLSRDVPEDLLQRKDEIGTLARGIQALAGSLRKQIGAITKVSSELVDISGYIQSVVSGIAAGSEETASAMVETTATLEEIRSAAGMTDEKSRSVATNSKIGLQSLQTANESMGRLWEGIDRIGERMPILAESILHLDAQSQEIGEITETVEEIAGQSNILAVNAALEAAKSGEQGKGFWVVAREVRSLAEHSKKSTLQVQGILREIRKAAAAAVSAAEQGVEIVEAGTQEAVHARESVARISAELEDSARSAEQIAAATGELLGGMNQAAKAMESIKGASIRNVSGMKEIEKAAKSLSEMSTTLSGLLEQYRLR
jgi:methyl-accepting chemotaxis protein